MDDWRDITALWVVGLNPGIRQHQEELRGPCNGVGG